MSIHTNKSTKSNPQPQDFATGEEYARACREVRAPQKCHGGEGCWRIYGPRFCSKSWSRKGSQTPHCITCGGFIVTDDGRRSNGGKGRQHD